MRIRDIEITKPLVMGILNCTPDSFYEQSRVQTEKAIAERAEEILREGGTMIDIGGMSTRPGGDFVTEEEERRRVSTALAIVRRNNPKTTISVDTYRPSVARMAVEEYGADIINDVSEGGLTGLEGVSLEETDADLVTGTIFTEVARLKVPYILMSVQPTMERMVENFRKETALLHQLGVKDIILDPGYGFGKTINENYAVLQRQKELEAFGMPILAGVSRKRMIWQHLGITPAEALNGTTVVNTIALLNGATILRVHDVREAVEAVRITSGC